MPRERGLHGEGGRYISRSTPPPSPAGTTPPPVHPDETKYLKSQKRENAYTNRPTTKSLEKSYHTHAHPMTPLVPLGHANHIDSVHRMTHPLSCSHPVPNPTRTTNTRRLLLYRWYRSKPKQRRLRGGARQTERFTSRHSHDSPSPGPKGWQAGMTWGGGNGPDTSHTHTLSLSSLSLFTREERVFVGPPPRLHSRRHRHRNRAISTSNATTNKTQETEQRKARNR